MEQQLEVKHSFSELPDNLVIVAVSGNSFTKVQEGTIKFEDFLENCPIKLKKKELEVLVLNNKIILKTCNKDQNFWFKKENLNLFYKAIEVFIDLAEQGAFALKLKIKDLCDYAFICQETFLNRKYKKPLILN